jgi:hypothetical protein
MKLTELAQPKKVMAQRALREHYEVDVDLFKLNAVKTKTMLQRVRDLLSETRETKSDHEVHNDPSFNKLMMMEQMLSEHYQDLRVTSRIVVENEEVQKSQVILAAQDLIDQVQKMVEDISKVNAEELPAVVTGIANEIGTTESQQFNDAASTTLSTLQQSLIETRTQLTNALSTITGESVDEVPEPFDAGGEDMDLDSDVGDEEIDDMDMDIDSPDGSEDLDVDVDIDDDETIGLAGAGRAVR